MAVGTALAIGAGIGALGGALGSKSGGTSTSSVNAGVATDAENRGQNLLLDNVNKYAGLVDAGAGLGDVTAATGANRDLAAMLARYSQEGGAAPGQGDIMRSNTLANQLFAGQQTALNQSFEDQSTAAARQAALMGRSSNDPILRAKLAQEQTRQQSLLSANQGAWATQYAMGQPGERLGFAQQRAGVLGGLASQALANRQSLAAMGEGIMTNERNFRLQTADRTNSQQQSSGGGLGGALTGAIGGLGAGASIGSMFGAGSSLPSFGAQSSPSPFSVTPGAFSGSPSSMFASNPFSQSTPSSYPTLNGRQLYGPGY